MTQLWAPWRSRYMNEKRDKRVCVFCDAAQQTADEENLIIHRGKNIFVILNRYPYTSGHVMIAPYSHVSRLAQATRAAAEEMIVTAARTERILQEAYQPDGLNMGMNLGEAAGAGIEEHIHMHVLPRWKGDANFMTSVSETRVIPEALEETYRKLRPRFLEA